MRFPRTRTTELLRRLTALGLVAWLAGAACVLGCTSTLGAIGALGATTSAHHPAPSQTHAAQNESHPAEQADSCAEMRGRDCCGRVEDKEQRASAGAEGRSDRTAMHCPLGGRSASDPARKVRVDTTPTTSAPATQSPAPTSSYVTAAHPPGMLVRDRGSTHLHCCVFLI